MVEHDGGDDAALRLVRQPRSPAQHHTGHHDIRDSSNTLWCQVDMAAVDRAWLDSGGIHTNLQSVLHTAL